MKFRMEWLSNIVKAAKPYIPEICVGTGIATSIFGTIWAIRQTPKALQAVRDDLVQKTECSDEVIRIDHLIKMEEPSDILKLTWRYYVGPGICIISGIGLEIVGVSARLKNSSKQAAMLSALLSASEQSARDYQKAAVETVGEKKEKQIHDRMVEDRVAEHPYDPNCVTYTGFGNQLFYDMTADRYFRSSRTEIDKIINKLNRDIGEEVYIDLGDYYDEMKLEQTSICRELGWNTDDGRVPIDPKYTPMMTRDGTDTCTAVDFYTRPHADYRPRYRC